MESNDLFWSRKKWAFHIGFFLMRFANIKDAICMLKISLDTVKHLENYPLATASNAVPKGWYDLQIEEQATKLIRQLEDISLDKYNPKKSKNELISLLHRLIKIKDTRNTLAHGTFAVMSGSTPQTPNYCVFSRAQINEQNNIVSTAKIIPPKEMEFQINESTHIEIGISSYALDLLRTLKVESLPTTYELTFDARAHEARLSLLIGQFMVHMGEIENLVHMVYQSVLDPTYGGEHNSPIIKLNGYWDSLTLSKQIKDLLERLPFTTEYITLREVLHEIADSGLIGTRNTLSHAKVCHQLSPAADSLALVAMRKTRKSPEILSESEVVRSIRIAFNFSNSLSKALAIARMALMKPFNIR